MSNIKHVIRERIKNGTLLAKTDGTISINGRETIGTVCDRYRKVCLTFNKVQVSASVHQIVWMYFNGDIPDSLYVDHINRDKSDNRLSNLRLVTPLGNSRNRVYQGGENNPSAKLNRTKVMSIIREYWDEKKSSGYLAKKYKVTDVTILNIVKGKTWSRIGEAV